MLIRLTGKTRKGKNKLHEAGTTQWWVITRPQEVAFAPELHLSIAPCDEWGNPPDNWMELRQTRWIAFPTDPDFDYDANALEVAFEDEL